MAAPLQLDRRALTRPQHLRPAQLADARNALIRMQQVGQLPERVDLQLYQGDTFSMSLVLTDEEDNPVDLSEMTAQAQIRATPASAGASDFETSIDGNVIELYLSHATATDLPGRGVWDCQLTDENGRVTTVVMGNVAVEPEVTR